MVLIRSVLHRGSVGPILSLLWIEECFLEGYYTFYITLIHSTPDKDGVGNNCFDQCMI